MMDNQVVSTISKDVIVSGLGKAKYGDDKQFGEIATTSGFLPRLQLYGSSANEVKRGKIGMGRWGLVRSKDNLEDMTAAVDTLVLSWRPKALRFGGEEEIVSVFNPENAEFKKIQVDSEETDSHCAWGPEFLVYIPTSNPSCFATLFCGSKTSRREAPNIKGLMGRAATLKVILIETKKYSWHGQRAA